MVGMDEYVTYGELPRATKAAAIGQLKAVVELGLLELEKQINVGAHHSIASKAELRNAFNTTVRLCEAVMNYFIVETSVSEEGDICVNGGMPEQSRMADEQKTNIESKFSEVV